jgi:hypothetical protein
MRTSLATSNLALSSSVRLSAKEEAFSFIGKIKMVNVQLCWNFKKCLSCDCISHARNGNVTLKCITLYKTKKTYSLSKPRIPEVIV